MRTTVGWGSYRAAQALRTTKFGSSKTGRLTMKMLDRGAKGSFDARASKAWKEIPFGGIDAGKIDKVAVGGYRAKYDKNVKEYRDYIKSVTDAIGDRGNTKEPSSSIPITKQKLHGLRKKKRIQISAWNRRLRLTRSSIPPARI